MLKVSLPLLLIASTLSVSAFAQSKKKAPAQPAPAAEPAAEIPPPPAPMASDVAGMNVMSGHASLPYALSFSIPGGGSFFDGATAGGRLFLSESTAVHGALMLSHSKAKKTTSIGVMGRYISYLNSSAKISPYYFGGGAVGVNTGDGPKATKTDGLVLGLMGGLGVELWILPELSLFGDVGLNLSLLPDDAFELTTFTSKIGANFNFAKF